MMKLENLSIPMLILSIVLCAACPRLESADGHWEYDEDCQMNFYVYETTESATYEGESGGVGYFRTQDGNVWGCYIVDTDLVDGEEVTLTFENRVPKSEYDRAQETGIEYSETREDSGSIIAID